MITQCGITGGGSGAGCSQGTGPASLSLQGGDRVMVGSVSGLTPTSNIIRDKQPGAATGWMRLKSNKIG